MAQTVILMMNEKIDIIKSFLWIYKITKRKIDMCRKRFHSHTYTHTHKPKNRQIFLTQHSQSLQSQDYKTQQQQQQLPWLFVFCCFSGWSLLLLNAASVRCCRWWCWLYSGSRAGTLLIDFAVLGITVACVTTISSSCGFLCGAVQAFVPGKLFVKFLFTVVFEVVVVVVVVVIDTCTVKPSSSSSGEETRYIYCARQAGSTGLSSAVLFPPPQRTIGGLPPNNGLFPVTTHFRFKTTRALTFKPLHKANFRLLAPSDVL